MTCHRHRFVRDTFHQAAITCKCIRVMINDRELLLVERSCKMSLSHSHTNSHCDPLTKRTCCCIYAICMTEFWMSWCSAVQLTELFNIINRYFITKCVKQAVQKRRAVTSRQYEAVAVKPFRMTWVAVHLLSPKCVRHRRCSHRKTWMT